MKTGWTAQTVSCLQSQVFIHAPWDSACLPLCLPAPHDTNLTHSPWISLILGSIFSNTPLRLLTGFWFWIHLDITRTVPSLFHQLLLVTHIFPIWHVSHFSPAQLLEQKLRLDVGTQDWEGLLCPLRLDLTGLRGARRMGIYEMKDKECNRH